MAACAAPQNPCRTFADCRQFLCPKVNRGVRTVRSLPSFQTTNSTSATSSHFNRCGLQRPSLQVEHTDVVVIGNGPSGISLSYILSGHWPYYTGAPHSDESLTLRLSSEGTDKSLLHQDLAFLSSGLEGRSSNPVALLFDALLNPDADLGLDLPSLLRWEYRPEQAIPHVVLGRHDVGGTWQTVEGHIQTLSRSDWMQLPDMPFRQWRNSRCRDQQTPQARKPELQPNRASAADVRNYYKQYVEEKGLRPNFRPHTVVTSVERVLSCSGKTDCESGEEDFEPHPQSNSQLVWEVRGFREDAEGAGCTSQTEFCYRAKSVVLACGAFDVPNCLNVPGERHDYVLHSLTELDEWLERGQIVNSDDPVVIVGSGLSAADAILRVRSAGLPVAHIFRHNGQDPLAVFRQLPPALYPDYDAVHQLMKSSADQGRESGKYRSYSTSSVKEFTADRQVVLNTNNGQEQLVVRASCVVVLIGSRPNLSFLRGDEKEIGVVPGVAIDGKRNPIDVNPYTYQSNRRNGLYAVGPLVGDNFVRFLRGGAVGVVSDILSKRDKTDGRQIKPFVETTRF